MIAGLLWHMLLPKTIIFGDELTGKFEEGGGKEAICNHDNLWESERTNT